MKVEFNVGDVVRMRRGVKEGAVGDVIEIFKYPNGRRGLKAKCNYAEVFEMKGYFVEFELIQKKYEDEVEDVIEDEDGERAYERMLDNKVYNETMIDEDHGQ